MSKTREKKVVISGISREQAEEAFASYAMADARQQQLTAKMDQQITKIREQYSDDLADLQETKDKAFAEMQVFGLEQKDNLFSKKKSLELTHGIIGFRTSTPTLKPRKGFTWNAITNLLKEFLPAYVRIKEEPAKDKLISDREIPEVSNLFDKVGVYVDQDEAFFVECKKEEVVA
ncbi:MAG: host-nuclease inhibitor Gam family protein [Bacteroidota bacterium]